MKIIPINFGSNSNAARSGDTRREQEALDAYSTIVTGVVEGVAAAMVGIQRKARAGAFSGDPRLQGGAGSGFGGGTPGQKSSCGCRVPGDEGGSDATVLAGLAALVGAITAARRRRGR